eukprot:2701632-Pleurochrysis_carterae.AAC.1
MLSRWTLARRSSAEQREALFSEGMQRGRRGERERETQASRQAALRGSIAALACGTLPCVQGAFDGGRRARLLQSNAFTNRPRRVRR